MKNSNPTDVLNTVFGYKTFRSNQEEIIRHIIAGNDALVLMPTGGGKSLVFQIPALCLEGTAIVVSPLISLMQDQVNALKAFGVRAAILNSTLSADAAYRTTISMINGEFDLVYVSPERLNTESFLESLSRTKISLFAIDEAHCVSQWGHDFRPEYTKFSMLKERFPNIRRVALTATADKTTREDIIKTLHLEDCKVFISGFDRANIHYSVGVKDREKKQLLNFITKEHSGDSGIVYCISRKKVEDITEFLKAEGFNAFPYHAGLDKKTREQNQDRFIKEDSVIMVATIAFGMGIDKSDVRFVAHMDLPKSMESYYQETGRAGRDGLPSDAWLVYGLQDIVWQRSFIGNSTADDEHKKLECKKLNSIIGYVESVDCRRRVLLDYFDEKYPRNCGNCDNCLNPPITYDATSHIQKLLSCIYRVNVSSGSFGFGAGHFINILIGKEDEKVKRYSHDKLSTFGIGKDVSVSQWQAITRQLVIKGLIDVDPQHQTIKLTPKAISVLKDKNAKVELRKDIPKTKKPGAKEKREFASDKDSELFKKLKALRLELAKQENMPPYIIFHDKTLMEMASREPKTMSDMGKISGVGEHKLKTYGEAFLRVINEELS
ncbi:MAG: DNA helicase RecQ [Campylobacteraceae bacterium]|nr:DNA helicase RecQ [Campylobacteraceae bacterium]